MPSRPFGAPMEWSLPLACNGRPEGTVTAGNPDTAMKRQEGK